MCVWPAALLLIQKLWYAGGETFSLFCLGTSWCRNNNLGSKRSVFSVGETFWVAREINGSTLNTVIVKLLNCERLRGLTLLPATLPVLFPVLPWARPGLGYLSVCPVRQKTHCAVGDRTSVAARCSVCSSRELLLHWGCAGKWLNIQHPKFRPVTFFSLKYSPSLPSPSTGTKPLGKSALK